MPEDTVPVAYRWRAHKDAEWQLCHDDTEYQLQIATYHLPDAECQALGVITPQSL